MGRPRKSAKTLPDATAAAQGRGPTIRRGREQHHVQGGLMTEKKMLSRMTTRRAILQAGAAAGGLQIAAPFILSARGEAPLKLRMVDPLTGVYASVAKSEVEGANLAVAQINRKGGVLGRQIELLVEDSANDVGTGVQKTHK